MFKRLLRPFQRFSLNESRRALFIQTEPTPNENSLIFRPGKPVLSDSHSSTVEFTSPKDAARSSRLAAEIFAIDGVTSVLFGPDFITVNKNPEALWIHLRPSIYSAIMDQFTMHPEEQLVKPPTSSKDGLGSTENNSDTLAVKAGDSQVVTSIKEILATRVRPVIQGDGGDIQFLGFDAADGIVRLALQGACRSCASSALTLKNGIQNMLMFYIPEVKGVREEKLESQQIAEDAFKQFERSKLQDKKSKKRGDEGTENSPS